MTLLGGAGTSSAPRLAVPKLSPGCAQPRDGLCLLCPACSQAWLPASPGSWGLPRAAVIRGRKPLCNPAPGRGEPGPPPSSSGCSLLLPGCRAAALGPVVRSWGKAGGTEPPFPPTPSQEALQGAMVRAG